ncbi:MAG: hypothetical protein R2800_15025 [Flavipsychrobacter sp.]
MMNNEMYYEQVKRWIDSYRDAGPLSWLRRFVDNSQQPEEVKQRLYREIDRKIACLNKTPWFAKWNDDIRYLMDQNGYPEVFTTRYSAVNKIIQLRKYGFDVRLIKGSAFFRIQLIQSAPIDEHQPLDVLTAHSLVA